MGGGGGGASAIFFLLAMPNVIAPPPFPSSQKISVSALDSVPVQQCAVLGTSEISDEESGPQTRYGAQNSGKL